MVDGNIMNPNSQDELNLKAPLHNPTFSKAVLGISKGMVDLAHVDGTCDSAKPMSTATQNALDLKAHFIILHSQEYKDGFPKKRLI